MIIGNKEQPDKINLIGAEITISTTRKFQIASLIKN